MDPLVIDQCKWRTVGIMTMANDSQTTLEIKAGAMIPVGSLRDVRDRCVINGSYQFDNYLYLNDSDITYYADQVERTCLVNGGYINGYLYKGTLLGVLLRDGQVRLLKVGHNLIEG